MPRTTRERLVLACVLIAVSIGIGVAFDRLMRRASPVEPVARDTKTSIASFPLVCELNQRLEIADQTFEGSGTLILAQPNCKLKITRSRLKGDVVVRAKNQVEIEIASSTLEGNDVAIRTERNTKILSSQDTVLRGTAAAIDAGFGTEFVLVESRIEGRETAIIADKNASLGIRHTSVTAQRYGVKSGVNLELRAVDATIRGNDAALSADANLVVEALGGLFEGGEAAILAKAFKPSVSLSQKARLVGRSFGVVAGSNLRLNLNDALIEAGDVGVAADSNARVDLRADAKIQAGRVALRLGLNAEIAMSNASIESDQHAICAEYNLAISAQHATIQAKADALRLLASPRRFEVVSSQIVGKKNYAAKDCAP